jgi:glycosyltransferase involved in cell wall biosynthesis
MRVVIDAVPLLVRSAGVKNYLYYWIEYLRRAAGADQIRTFPPFERLGLLNHDASVAGRWRTGLGLAELALNNYSPLPVMDFLCRGADIFHASALVRRPPRKVRLTATIYDMTCFLMPELHPAANLRADRSFAALMRRAEGLIAISECTKQDAVRVLGIPEDRIAVIHPGIAPAFFDPSATAVAAVRKRYGLVRPFVLFVGTIEPRKNLGVLLDAFDALPASIRQECDLAIAGPVGWAPAESIARLDRVRYLGYVPEADIAPLTAAATVFAYPSLYEGFGFPVAQAMAAGVPVVTSNVSSLPEIAGDAAVLVDPRSQSELRDALARLLLSSDLRTELVRRGRARAQAFRWEACAAKSLQFFRDQLGSARL